jgi:hypothetical protein
VGCVDAGHTLASARADASELLDVDVEQLAWASSLVVLCGLHAEPAELAHPDPGQDPGHGQERHVERLGDLRTGHPQPSERSDHLEAALIGGFAISTGAEERSSSPCGPSAQWRVTHLRAVRSLIPAASAAALSDHPAFSTRSINNRGPSD